MTNLSPAAQAVLDAYFSSLHKTPHQSVASALRAVVKQAMPVVKSPWSSTMNTVLTGMESRDRILAIAAELEGANG